MKKLFVTCALIMGAILIAPGTVSADAVGATAVDITLPDIVILHYFSTVSVEFDQDEFGMYVTGNALGDQTINQGPAAPAAAGLTQDLAMSPTALSGSSLSAALLTLRNAWAVRAISSAGETDTQLTIANTSGTLNNTTTGSSASIVVTAVAVDDGSTNGTSITFTAPGLVTPLIGNVELTLDLTNAVNGGNYTGGIYTLTASNI